MYSLMSALARVLLLYSGMLNILVGVVTGLALTLIMLSPDNKKKIK